MQAIQIDVDFSKYITSKIISLTKSGNNNATVTDTLQSLSGDNKLPFIPEIYMYLIYEGDEAKASSYIHRYHDNNDYDDFVINCTLAIVSENNLSKTPSFNNMINSYKKVFDKGFIFLCSSCGYKSKILNWLCPSCNNWSTSKPITTIDLIQGGQKNAGQ